MTPKCVASTLRCVERQRARSGRRRCDPRRRARRRRSPRTRPRRARRPRSRRRRRPAGRSAARGPGARRTPPGAAAPTRRRLSRLPRSSWRRAYSARAGGGYPSAPPSRYASTPTNTPRQSSLGCGCCAQVVPDGAHGLEVRDRRARAVARVRGHVEDRARESLDAAAAVRAHRVERLLVRRSASPFGCAPSWSIA